MWKHFRALQRKMSWEVAKLDTSSVMTNTTLYFLTRFGTIPGKSRLSRLFYRLFCQIFLWFEVSQPAWINSSTAPSCRKCQNCWIFTISSPVVWGNQEMCAHCMDENTRVLEVGSQSVKQGSREGGKCLQKVTYRINENEAVMFAFLLCSPAAKQAPSHNNKDISPPI